MRCNASSILASTVGCDPRKDPLEGFSERRPSVSGVHAPCSPYDLTMPTASSIAPAVSKPTTFCDRFHREVRSASPERAHGFCIGRAARPRSGQESSHDGSTTMVTPVARPGIANHLAKWDGRQFAVSLADGFRGDAEETRDCKGRIRWHRFKNRCLNSAARATAAASRDLRRQVCGLATEEGATRLAALPYRRGFRSQLAVPPWALPRPTPKRALTIRASSGTATARFFSCQLQSGTSGRGQGHRDRGN